MLVNTKSIPDNIESAQIRPHLGKTFLVFFLLSPVQIDWHSCLLPVSHPTASATSLDIFTTVNPDAKIKSSNKTYCRLYKSSSSRLIKLELDYIF